MIQYYLEMITSQRFLRAKNNHPKMVIALDEAHVLRDDSEPRFSRVNVLLQTIKEYSQYDKAAVWVVFASTTSKIVRLPTQAPQALCT